MEDDGHGPPATPERADRDRQEQGARGRRVRGQEKEPLPTREFASGRPALADAGLDALTGTWAYGTDGGAYRLLARGGGALFQEGPVSGLLRPAGSGAWLEGAVEQDGKLLGIMRLRLVRDADVAVSMFRSPGDGDAWSTETLATRCGGAPQQSPPDDIAQAIDPEDCVGAWVYGEGHQYKVVRGDGRQLVYTEGGASAVLRPSGLWLQGSVLADGGEGAAVGRVRLRPGYSRGTLESQFCRWRSSFWAATVVACRALAPPAPPSADLLAASVSSRQVAEAAKMEEEPPLSEEQERLVAMVLDEGRSVFFTGAAGTGKSRTMRELVRRAPEKNTFVTALTGMAATQLPRGTTLHRFAGIGVGAGTKEACLERARRNLKAQRNWAAARLLIVDEASMMSKALFERLDYVARAMKQNDSPFGGVVLCLCGDFFQLPPVARGVGDERLFCFESEVWRQCFAHQPDRPASPQRCFALTEVFRQRDERLVQLLTEVRHNRLSQWGLQTLRELGRELVARDIEPTRLFPTNAGADTVNAQRLAALPAGEGRCAEFIAADKAPYSMLGDGLDQLANFPRRLELRVGAQVMLLKNLTPTLVNGSRGVVEGFVRRLGDDCLPVVRFRSGEVVVVEKETDTKDLMGGQRFSRHQVPLRLSWAITIHKSQGMTIDFVEVDLGSVFEAGQAYVALSRARSLDGLRVLSFDPNRFWTSPKVSEFYQTQVRPI